MQTIGEKLKRLREAHKLTQKALSELSKVSVRTIRYIETNGRGEPGVRNLRKLAQALNVNLAALVD